MESGSGVASYIDVLDRVLDKGIVVDAWIRVSVAGLDLITIEALVIVASVGTYQKYWPALWRGRRAPRWQTHLSNIFSIQGSPWPLPSMLQSELMRTGCSKS
jgi:hypothetical protein